MQHQLQQLQSPTSPMAAASGGRGQRRRTNRGPGSAASITRFAELLRASGGPPPPPPPHPTLTATEMAGSAAAAAAGKMKVIVKVVSKETGGLTCISADSRRRQVTVFDPAPLHHHRSSAASTSTVSAASPATTAAGLGKLAPKLFSFDAVFTEESSLPELCSAALPDIIQGVVNGSDGCVFVFGYGGLGKTHTMIGSDVSPSSAGVIPCAIAWLFRAIGEQREAATGARFSVRVSAVELAGRDEALRDLLGEAASPAASASSATAAAEGPTAAYLRDDPITGSQLENQSELRAPTPEKAAAYLDAALSARSTASASSGGVDSGGSSMSHLLFTLHLYQYRVERTGISRGVAGGRSRLHLIDLGCGRGGRDSGHPALSLAAIGSVLAALVNGQRRVPHRDSKLSQLLREALGSTGCRACMICQVSSMQQNASDSLQILQFANRIQRMRRRRARLLSCVGGVGSSGPSSGSNCSGGGSDSSSCDSFGVRRAGRLRPSQRPGETDYSSGSEHSCATVIFMGKRDHPDSSRLPPPPPQALLRKLARAAASDDDDNGGGGVAATGEQWIDGPRAPAIKPHAAPVESAPGSVGGGERWIDGPKASPPTTPPSPIAAAAAASAAVPSAGIGRCRSRHTEICDPPQQQQQPPPAPAKKDAETQSEEPYESGSSTSTSSTLDRAGGERSGLSDISEQTEDATGGVGIGISGHSSSSSSPQDAEADEEEEEASNEALERLEIPPPPPDFGGPVTAAIPPVMKKAAAAALMAAAEVPVNSVASATAPTGPLAVSSSTADRPALRRHRHRSPGAGGASSLPRQRNPQSAASAEPSAPLVARVKPFVRDWVEKHHSVGPPASQDSDSPKLDSRKQQQQQQLCQSACASPVHSRPPHHPSGSRQHQHQHQHQHQRRSRSAKGRRQPEDESAAAPPSPAPAHARVAQWLQGVEPDELSRALALRCGAAEKSVPSTIAATSITAASHQRSGSHGSELVKDSAAAAQGKPQLRDRSTSAHRRGGDAVAEKSSGRQSSEKKPSRLASFLTSPLFGVRRAKVSKEAKAAAGGRQQKQDETAVTSPVSGSAATRATAAPPTILSPYHTVTQPRNSGHSSSGHGSDCSYHPLYCVVSRRRTACSGGSGGGGGTGSGSGSGGGGGSGAGVDCGGSGSANGSSGGGGVGIGVISGVSVSCGGSGSGVGGGRSGSGSGGGGSMACPGRGAGGTGCASSGYESMLRDSEASSCRDSASERSAPTCRTSAAASAAAAAARAARRKAAHRKLASGRSRSKSIPPDGSSESGIADAARAPDGDQADLDDEGDARAADNVEDDDEQEDDAATATATATVEAGVGVASFDTDGESDDQEDEAAAIAWQIRREKIAELVCQQRLLKEELRLAKSLLMADPNSWTFDLHVADSMDPESPGFLDALRAETGVLSKRVAACKSHLAMLTCFDARPHEQ